MKMSDYAVSLEIPTKPNMPAPGFTNHPLKLRKDIVAWLRHESKRRHIPQGAIVAEAIAILASRQLVSPPPPPLFAMEIDV